MEKLMGYVVIAWFIFWATVAVGWVINVVHIVGLESFTPFTGELAVRIVGIFIPPLGAIMGFFF